MCDILRFTADIESKENIVLADQLLTKNTYTFQVLLSENKDEVVPVMFDFHVFPIIFQVKLHF